MTLREKLIDIVAYNSQTVSCEYCDETIEIDKGTTRYIAVQHSNCPPMVVDMKTGDTYDEHLTGGLNE